jgi:hypothetical protein
MIHLDIATLRCSLSQALRLYVYPYFRPTEVDPTTTTTTTTTKEGKTKGNVSSMKKARSPSPKSKRQPTATGDAAKKKKASSIQPSEITSDQQSLSEPIEERQRPSLQLQQLNMVIFGLPNLTFTP